MAEIFKLSNRKIKEVQDELKDLKEALYGYVLDTAQIETTGAIPQTITIGSGTYNLVDDVRGLVKSINGTSEVTTNLLNIADKAATTTNGVTYSISNGVITLNGTASDYFTIYINSNIVSLNGNYVFSTFNLASSRIDLYLWGNNVSNLILYQLQSQTQKTFTVSTTSEYKGLSIYFPKNSTFTNYQVKPMLVRGSTAPTTFKPYFASIKSVIYEGLKVSGANLFYMPTSKLGYYVTGYNGLEVADTNAYGCSDFIPVKAGDVLYFSGMRLLNVGSSGCMYDSNKNYVSTINNDTDLQPLTIPSGIAYIRINVWAYYWSNNPKPMLNKGTTALAYKPYKGEPVTILPFNATTLRGANEVKDKIVITKNTSDDYYTATKVTNVGFEFLGSLEWTYNSAQNVFYSNGLTNAKNNGICSKYSFDTTATAWNVVSNGKFALFNGVAESGKASVVIKDTNYTDAAAFKSAMGAVLLHYELATPTTTVLSATLTEADVMPLLELGGSVEVLNNNSAYVQGSTVIEMVYKLINTDTAASVSDTPAVLSEEEPTNE